MAITKTIVSLFASIAAVNAAVLSERDSGTLYYFAFGDSYTTTAFDINGVQPSPGNPMGNPPLGQGTFAGGINYVGFLTTVYNSSLVLGYDFGSPGATISDSVVPTDNSDIHTFEQQVEYYFEPMYTTNHVWKSDNSYFSIFFGINDIGLPLTEHENEIPSDVSERVTQLLDYYFSLVDNLYAQGARRFMFVGVPPLDRSPYIMGFNQSVQSQYSDTVNTFNGALAQRITQWTQQNDGAITATYDYHRWMTNVLNDPGSIGFPDATCVNSDGQSCIWWNSYHVSSAFDNYLAQRMLPAMNSLGFSGGTPTGGYFY